MMRPWVCSPENSAGFLKERTETELNKEKRYSKSNDSNSSSYTCFGCGKPGLIKVDCPNNQNKEKSASKKNERGKGKRAYISWEENDVSSQQVTLKMEVKKQICASWWMMKDQRLIQ